MNSKYAVQCRNINKTYGEKDTKIQALKNINLDIEAGKLTLLVGPSGSGKTTLLSIITAILHPDNGGQVFLLGEEITKMSDDQKAVFCRDNLGIVFQSLFLIPTLTVCENVSMPLLIKGKTQKESAEQALAALKKMNIDHRCNVSPSNLSKGQQQKVAIARAMVNNAKILVCDEPTSALDQNAGLETMDILKHLATDANKAVIVVTHDHRIFSFGDRIITMNDGEIIGNEHE